MREDTVLGIIFSNMHDETLGELTNVRTMGSVPFGGRYRFIDFPLSNMVNSGISNVGVVTKSNYQSLIDHIGSGRPEYPASLLQQPFRHLPRAAGGTVRYC